MLDKSVHLCSFPESCGIPASYVKLVLGWDFDVMVGSVGSAWLEYMGFEPMCSGVCLVVRVMCGLPLGSGLGFGGRGVGVVVDCVWIV